MTKRILSTTFLVVALAVSLAPSGATAAPFTPHLERMYNLALQWWGEAPTKCVSIDTEIVPDSTSPRTMLAGNATMPRAAAAARSVPCHLWVRRWVAIPLRTVRACPIVFHEVGHLLGYDHSPDPHNIMSPKVTIVPRLCRRLARLERLKRRLRAAQAEDARDHAHWLADAVKRAASSLGTFVPVAQK